MEFSKKNPVYIPDKIFGGAFRRIPERNDGVILGKIPGVISEKKNLKEIYEEFLKKSQKNF